MFRLGLWSKLATLFLAFLMPEMANGQTNLTVTASAESPTPNPSTIGVQITTSLTASVTPPSPPYGCTLNSPTWSWTVFSVQYSVDNVNWGPSSGGDYESITQPDPTSPNATLNTSFSQEGYWQVTVVANVSYTDTCGNSWSGQGSTLVNFTVNKGTNQPLTVTASASASSPNPTTVDFPVSSSLSATVSNPPTGVSGPSWFWSVPKVQYSTDGVSWGPSPGGDSFWINQPNLESPSATMTASFSTAGYWQITVQATVVYYDGSGNTWSGSGTAIVDVTVITVVFVPDPVNLVVGGQVSLTANVTPANAGSQVSFATQNPDGSSGSNIATVAGAAPSLTVTGVSAGNTLVVGTLSNGIQCGWGNITVSPVLFVTASPTAICAGGLQNPLHQSIITATVVDANGNPVAGVAIDFSTTDGNLSLTSATTDGNGQASTVLTSSQNASDYTTNPPQPYYATVSASAATGQSGSIQVEFQPTTCAVYASPASIMTGESSTLTLNLTWDENPVAGHNISWNISSIWDINGNLIYDGTGTPPSGYGSLSASQSQTDANGNNTAVYQAGTEEGTIECTASDTSVIQQPSGEKPKGKAKVQVFKVTVQKIQFNNGAPAIRVDYIKDDGSAASVPLPEWDTTLAATQQPNNEPAAFPRGSQINLKVTVKAGANVNFLLQANDVEATFLGHIPPLFNVSQTKVTTDANGNATVSMPVATKLVDWVDSLGLLGGGPTALIMGKLGKTPIKLVPINFML